jgi:hypothetical protein
MRCWWKKGRREEASVGFFLKVFPTRKQNKKEEEEK